jgi:SAM-dependent methyltransferase
LTEAPSSARFFDSVARRYDRVYAPGPEETRRSLARVLHELSPASRVLDLGVGTGRELPALLDAGHSPVGLDASQEMLALCARRSRPVPLVHGDLWGPLPWSDGAFDAVIALHGTLSHPPSAEVRAAFPREVARVLRPRGVFVAEVPTEQWLERAVDSRGGRLTMIDAGRAIHVDDATGASVEVWALPEDGWRCLFEGVLCVRVEQVGDGELLIVGKREGR